MQEVQPNLIERIVRVTELLINAIEEPMDGDIIVFQAADEPHAPSAVEVTASHASGAVSDEFATAQDYFRCAPRFMSLFFCI